MMERCGNLNQPLQERLVRLLRLQPHALPRLMCSEELAGFVPSQTLGKIALRPVKIDQRRSPRGALTIVRAFEQVAILFG